MDRSALRTASAHVVVTAAELDADGPVVLDDDAGHHLRRVLRLRAGETVGVTDGAGRWRLATVIDGGGLATSSEVFVEPPRSRPVTIATAIPKGDRLDWLVQKVTELGVARIVLLDCDRSVVRWRGERVERQLARVRRIVDEALRQSRGVWRPVVEGPRPAMEFLGGAVVAEPGGRRLTVDDVTVAIGPEGGWSPAELAVAADRVGLGDTILRTETAAVAMAALCVTFDR